MTVLHRVLAAAAVLGFLFTGSGAAQADPASRWLVNDAGDGRCLDVDTDGGAVARPCSTARGQQRWIVRSTDSTHNLLVHESTGQCLRIAESQPQEFTQPFLAACPAAGSPTPLWMNWWVESPPEGGMRLLANGRYTMSAEGDSVLMRYKYRDAGSQWTPVAFGSSGKPVEGESCGIRACPPPSDS